MFETKQTPKGKTTYSVEFKWRAVQMYIEEVNGIYGYYRVKAWIKRNYGKTVNHKRVYRLMKELGIQAKIRRKKPKYKARKENIVASNVLNRDFAATAANQKWVTDITYSLFFEIASPLRSLS